jgi:hypothetical protein
LPDFPHITKLELEAEDVRWFAQTSSISPGIRRGILVSGDLEFGFGRMFEAHRENAGEKGIRVFRKFDDALDWVLAKNTNA